MLTDRSSSSQATYSGVPVYECIIKDVAVMRRRSDSWLNATQILKVVGLDKPQRTRVLEREIQKGIHEKVQGGYGKYQGTWIPLDIAIELAERYNIQALLAPITTYVPSATDSPPPAPKHTISTSNRSKKVLSADAGALGRSRRATSIETESEAIGATQNNASEGSMSPSPSDISSSSRTPSPMPADRANGPYGAQQAAAAHHNGRDATNQARYADIILDYFVTENTTVPSLLINPPPDFNPDMSIDDDEHTALHWACAMGRIRVVKLLLSAGADIFRVNTNQQTALMRATMFSNNYDLRKFPELFELLHRSILNIDRNDRTVFHHVVDLALSRGKPHAARYYMETMINRLADYGDQLADILNFQDDEGETPLTMAARARSKRLVRLLLEHGADPKIRNKEGKNAEDYIIEDERFRSSPSRTGPAGIELGADGLPVLPTASLHTSEAGQRTAGRAVTLMSNLLHSLADSYDSEIHTADKKLTQAHGLLKQIQTEIEDSAKVAEGLHHEAEGVDDERKRVDSLQLALKHGINKRTRATTSSAAGPRASRPSSAHVCRRGSSPVLSPPARRPTSLMARRQAMRSTRQRRASTRCPRARTSRRRSPSSRRSWVRCRRSAASSSTRLSRVHASRARARPWQPTAGSLRPDAAASRPTRWTPSSACSASCSRRDMQAREALALPMAPRAVTARETLP